MPLLDPDAEIAEDIAASELLALDSPIDWLLPETPDNEAGAIDETTAPDDDAVLEPLEVELEVVDALRLVPRI